MIKRRADAIEIGDIIKSGNKVLRVYAIKHEWDRVTFCTRINGWNDKAARVWSTDFRTEFEVLEKPFEVLREPTI